MSVQTQRWCAWCGPAIIAVFFVGFAGVARFMPPPSPTLSPDEVAAIFREHPDRIRVGLLMGMFAIGLIVPWGATLAVQLKRVEGRFSPLSYAQLASSVLVPVVFWLPMMCWLIAAYRPDQRLPSDLVLLNDAGWLMFVAMVFGGPPWLGSTGLAILRDRAVERGVEPVFPRWSGYLTLWVLLLIVPGCLCVFFTTGPFAWNGLMAFWVVLTVFACWVLVMSKLMLDAVAHQVRYEPGDEPADVPVDERVARG
jgi:hypothetical protein